MGWVFIAFGLFIISFLTNLPQEGSFEEDLRMRYVLCNIPLKIWICTVNTLETGSLICESDLFDWIWCFIALLETCSIFFTACLSMLLILKLFYYYDSNFIIFHLTLHTIKWCDMVITIFELGCTNDMSKSKNRNFEMIKRSNA